MDDKVNYTLVGAFVLVLGAVLVAAVLWLAAGLGGREPVDRYQAFIEESVAGLNLDAPVKLLGVDVGKVSAIQIDPNNSQQVRLDFLIVRGTPVKRDSVAVLKTQGLTGIAYVELSGGSAAAPALVAVSDGVVPTIPFKPSLSARLENVLTNVLANIDRVSNNLNAVFDADNRAALKSMLADTAVLARTLAGQQGALRAGITDAARTAQLVAQAGEQLAPTLERIAASAVAVERMATAAGAASMQAGRAADAAASGVQQLGADILPELARLMAELSQLSASVRLLSEQTAGSPNSLLVGRPAPRPGPGESARP
ncbi:MAG: mammalian cell entry protein [Burkholderiales bacterium RIFCSPHIGHO2_12_FULL_69_20]|nr:MAG: mammalian cell entry protein [Burkholderiales bacterium RIFCSPHIGHO2_12_FULL_69_20]